MSESSLHWSGSSPLPFSITLKPSGLLSVCYLLLSASAVVSCVLLLPPQVIGVPWRVLFAGLCAIYGMWLVVVHGLRCGAHTVKALTVFPDGTVRLTFGNASTLLLAATTRAEWVHPLCIHVQYKIGRRLWHRRTLLIAGDALAADAHRALRALLSRAQD